MQGFRPPHDSVDYFAIRTTSPAQHYQPSGGLFPPARPSPSPSSPAPTPSPSSFPAPKGAPPPPPPNARRLPRTSSLLPPPHVASGSFQSTTHPPLFESPRHPQNHVQVDHSSQKTNSAGPGSSSAASNRWSASTGSSRSNSVSVSRTSNTRPRLGRRTSSFDSTFLLAESPPISKQRSPPQKLQKARRPSSHSDHPPNLSANANEPDPQYIGLPTIQPLPSLEHSLHSNLSALHRPEGGSSPKKPKLFGSRTPDLSSRPAVVAASGPSARMPYDEDEDQQPRGHARSRSGKGSSDSTKSRGNKPPSQKAMLSRALQKANTAVQFDNAQDFEGARQSYIEACSLLQQVLQRTSADEDKRKLEAIRRTYTSRITELDQMLPRLALESKALPAFPDDHTHGLNHSSRHAHQEDAEEARPEIASVRKVPRDDSRSPLPQAGNMSSQNWNHDGRSGTATPQSALRPPLPIHSAESRFLQSSFSRSPVRLRFPDGTQQSQDSLGPAHISAKVIQSPPNPRPDSQELPLSRSDFSPPSATRSEVSRPSEHGGHESQNSWLDPIDESGGSTASSVHSRTSSLGYRRKHIRSASGDTEAEFDTALDAAIEAAYDEGYEPMDAEDYMPKDSDEEIVANAMRKVEIARERVRQTEREAYEVAHAQQRLRQYQAQNQPEYHGHEGFLDDNSSDEEERILEEFTRSKPIEDRSVSREQAGRQPAPSVPPESDTSSLTSRTWPNSGVSNAQSSATSLSTVTETMSTPSYFPNSAPTLPPPSHALPNLPPPRPSSAAQSVRNRRLSGQQHKQLKIETARLTPPVSSFADNTSSVPKSTTTRELDVDISASEAIKLKAAMLPPLSPTTDVSPTDMRPLESPFGHRTQTDTDDNNPSRSASPSVNKIRKNFSSSSLRSMKSRNMSVSHIDDAADMSPGTPSSAHWGGSRAPAMPALPAPLAASLRDRSETFPAGLGLLDDSFHSPNSPGSPNLASLDAPVPLEPCPTDFMLRPFWLMRCLYQTLVHPRGGYLSTKLFVPSGAWRVKGVKLKGLEDKIANCDFLTAALLKLARVDTCDADAMLEEMQSIENVMEQVQMSLGRKLGNEVGVQSVVALFRDGSTDGEPQSALPRSSSVSGKSSFSWRRLRSKNSTAALSTAQQNRSAGSDGSKEAPSMATLPMTAQPTSRPAKRDMSLAQFTGPNAHYMGSLARLFDAAQVIDQIARQVDDPGLRHADKTQVGLELCTRHAAEFFGFYVCRFVLTDLGMMMDKFIKRGTEWVLA